MTTAPDLTTVIGAAEAARIAHARAAPGSWEAASFGLAFVGMARMQHRRAEIAAGRPDPDAGLMATVAGVGG